MTKNTYILAALLCSSLSYGQQITFHKNVNYRASALLQSLNKDRDSLILECKIKQILKVDIFNEVFSESIDVYSNKTKINLRTLPVGNFVIQAKIDKKWITMYLEKNEDVKIVFSNQKLQDIGDIGLTPILVSNKNIKKENSLYYWVVSESNSNFGSNKSMRLEYKDDIAKLISKNKLELKSGVGKNNKLIIYEVYNTSKFMPKQLRNPVYYKTEESDFFNVVPIYTSDN